MSTQQLSRKEFLHLGGLALGSLALQPGTLQALATSSKPNEAAGLVRVAVKEMRLYSEPSYQSNVVATRSRDQLLYVFEEFESDLGPDFNPRWYKVDEGYAHTAYLQPVLTQLQTPQVHINPQGELFEITVPLTQSYRHTRARGWEKLYRLYYLSTHWVTGIAEGPDGALWYEITDELLKITYHVLAEHMRKVPASELTPVNAHIPLHQKYVEVSIPEQRLWAYEEGALILDTKVSTGIPYLVSTNGIPTATPKGGFTVFSKMPVRHMGDGYITADVEAYELPGVPWVSYFHEWGVAFHGTYWHDNYGNEMSHGCVNMKPHEAKWLFRWLMPESKYGQVQSLGQGTRVVVR
ncbi:MAG: L,D-transpeptidase [Anaerolineales bacterium]|nr:L,D-transpeptidase [Anaerolineales bacterium]